VEQGGTFKGERNGGEIGQGDYLSFDYPSS
jgi:hypothetical protein